jgi:hypothetical protein
MYPSNDKSRHKDVIHRDFYGGMVDAEVYSKSAGSVKIAGRYDRLSTDDGSVIDEDASPTESVVIGSPTKHGTYMRTSVSPNPYGSANAAKSTNSMSSEASWTVAFHSWQAQSILLYKAVMGQDIRSAVNSSSLTGSSGSTDSNSGRAVISGSWGSEDETITV